MIERFETLNEKDKEVLSYFQKYSDRFLKLGAVAHECNIPMTRIKSIMERLRKEKDIEFAIERDGKFVSYKYVGVMRRGGYFLTTTRMNEILAGEINYILNLTKKVPQEEAPKVLKDISNVAAKALKITGLAP
jgi:hypothetical protein